MTKRYRIEWVHGENCEWETPAWITSDRTVVMKPGEPGDMMHNMTRCTARKMCKHLDDQPKNDYGYPKIRVVEDD